MLQASKGRGVGESYDEAFASRSVSRSLFSDVSALAAAGAVIVRSKTARVFVNFMLTILRDLYGSPSVLLVAHCDPPLNLCAQHRVLNLSYPLRVYVRRSHHRNDSAGYHRFSWVSMDRCCRWLAKWFFHNRRLTDFCEHDGMNKPAEE